MTLAGVVAGAGVLVGLAVSSSTRDLRLAIRAALELFTAAGLLHLAADASWSALATAAAIVAIRKVVSKGLSTVGSPSPAIR